MRHFVVTLQITCSDSLKQTGTIQSKNALCPNHQILKIITSEVWALSSQKQLLQSLCFKLKFIHQHLPLRVSCFTQNSKKLVPKTCIKSSMLEC